MKTTPSCTVIGYGRFGTLMARTLAEEFEVSVVARSQDSKARAKSDGFKLIPMGDAGLAAMTVICVPISEFSVVVKQLSKVVTPDSLVIDTCSVKIYPVEIMQSELKCQLLATHPLFGPDSAKDGLNGLRMAVCPINIDDDRLQQWNTWWQSRGVEVIETTPDEHDWAMAYTQGITHFVGRVLGDLDLGSNPLATKGYEALLEVSRQTANDSWQLFLDLQSYNPYTKQMRQELFAAVDKIEVAISKLVDNSEPGA